MTNYMKSLGQHSIRMAHDNPGNVLTAGYPVSYVRFADSPKASVVKPGGLAAWFSYYPTMLLTAIRCNYCQLFATLKNIAFDQQPIL